MTISLIKVKKKKLLSGIVVTVSPNIYTRSIKSSNFFFKKNPKKRELSITYYKCKRQIKSTTTILTFTS